MHGDSVNKRSGKSRAYTIDAVLGALALILIYWIFPDFVQNIVFDLGIRKMALFLPVIPLGYLAWRYAHNEYKSHRRMVTGIVMLGVFSVVWYLGVGFTRDYFVYLAYGEYQQRDGLVQVERNAVRFTPLQNACVDLANAINISSEHVECANVRPILSMGNRFGYVAPITPSGFLQTFAMNNPGFQILDDSVGPKQRIRRIDDPQAIGVGMEWFDNLQRKLVLSDFFANYEKPHYLALDLKNPDKLTAVVSKIKYSHFFQLPYWAGVVLVHSDGKIEDLTKEAVLKDPRLKNQWVYPMELDQRYVNAQDYKVGWGPLSPLVRVPGKLEIEKLPGNNQFPFLTQGADGQPYLVTATKGEGSARGLFRMYYRNAYTGEGTYHEFKPDEIIYGAGAALGRATNIQGYTWKQGSSDSSSGTTIAVEPVYLTRRGEASPYWKFTVTNHKNEGISATVVSPGSRPDEMKVFRTRDEFEAWLNSGTHTPSSVVASKDREATIKEFLDQIDSGVAALRKLLSEKK